MEFESYEHPTDGFRLEKPVGWDFHEDSYGCSAVIVEPEPDNSDRFRGSLNIVSIDDGADGDLDAVTDIQIATMFRTFTDLRILDVEETQVAGLPGRRVLGAYRQGPFNLTTEQWWTSREGRTIVIAGTCESLAYPAQASVFGLIAESVEFVDG